MSDQQQPLAYRVMSDAERQPWDDWLQTSLRAERTKIFQQVVDGISTAIERLQCEVETQVSKHFVPRKEFDELKAEILQLRTNLSQKRWWNR